MSCTISNDLKAHNKKMQYYIKWHILRLYRPTLDSVNFIRNLSFRHRNILAALSSVGNTDFQPGFTWSMADLNTSLIKLNLIDILFYCKLLDQLLLLSASTIRLLQEMNINRIFYAKRMQLGSE